MEPSECLHHGMLSKESLCQASAPPLFVKLWVEEIDGVAALRFEESPFAFAFEDDDTTGGDVMDRFVAQGIG